MYWGMLLLGVPAMYLLRRSRQRFDLRKWCCTGPLLLGVPGMCLGMWAGAQVAAQLGGRLTMLDAHVQVLLSYVFMMLGMGAGMLLPHVMELSVRSPAAN
jgi:hypothetical protein